MFAMIDAGERAGSGISKIFYGWSETGYAAPFYEEEYGPDRTILTLPLVQSYDTDSSDIKSDELNRTNQSYESAKAKTVDRKKAIASFLKENGPSTRMEIADAIGLKASRTSELLAAAIDEGLIEAEGKTKNRMFKIPEKSS